MNFDYRMTGNKFIKFDGKKEDENNNKTPLLEEAPEALTEQPESKPVTLSIQDVLASYSQGGLKVIATTGNNGVPEIDEGVTEFEYEGSEIITYKRKDDLSIQVRGKIDPSVILKKLPNLKPIEFKPADTSGADGSNGVNGEIDEKVSQGGTGDCWVLTGVLALNSSATGKRIIKESIQSNPDGSVTINFKGLGVSYTITADEIEKYDTDNIKNDPYSNGDNDMLVLELATKKLMADIASGKVKLDVPADSVEAIYNKDGGIEGGFAQNMIYYLTGQQADFVYAYGQEEQGLSEQEVLSFLKDAYKNGNSVLTFGVYGSGHRATEVDGTPYKLDISGGHALAITNLTATTVTFVNPWDSTKEYTMTWQEFAKLGIGMLTSTDLSALDDVTPSDPVNPPEPTDPDATIYSADNFKDIPQSIIDKYLEPIGFNADGTVIEYALKSPYTDINFSKGQEVEDGSKPDLSITLTSRDENGNEVVQSLRYYTQVNLTDILGGGWWRIDYAAEYFEYDKDLGLYMLKEGKTLEELKNNEPVYDMVDIGTPADPNSWQAAINNVTGKTTYLANPVTENLSQGVIDRFFEPEVDSESGKTWGYTLKKPYTGFKLASESTTHRTYEFSYIKDGVKYIASVKIDKSNGSYRIYQEQEEYNTPNGDSLNLKEILNKINMR